MNARRWITFEMPNGLRLAVRQQPANDLVCLQVRYRVGSRDEGPREWGYAHLLEHLLSQPDNQTPPGRYRREIRRLGGTSSATTWLDFTKYCATFPAAALKIALSLEAERMTELLIDEPRIAANCNLIAVERQWVESQESCGLWDEALQQLAFPKAHGYHHSPFGTVKSLAACTPKRMRRFHGKHYVPNNASIAIEGDIEPEVVEEMVRRAFGALPARPLPPRLEPAPAAGQQFAWMTVEAGLPHVYLAYAAPPLGAAQHHYLDLIGDVLATGRTCRLARLQRSGAPLMEYGYDLFPWLTASLVVIWASVQSNSDLAAAADCLASVVEHFEAPTQSEIERALAIDRLRTTRLLEFSAERVDYAALAVEQGWDPNQLPWTTLNVQTDKLLDTAALFHPDARIQLEYKSLDP